MILYAKKQLNEIEKKRAYLEEKIATYPPGELSFRLNGKYKKWFICKKTEVKKEYQHISSKNKEMISIMSLKKLDMIFYSNLIKKRNILNSFISQMQKIDKEIERNEAQCKIYRANINKEYLDVESKQKDVYSGALFSIKEKDEIISKWMQEPYIKCQKYKERLTVPTLSGIYVRSKSESMIADELFRKGIPFRYECELRLKNGSVIYPDFTILCPWNFKVYYWEHFGLMDNEDYRSKTYYKLREYGDNEIIPMVDLITTYETKYAMLGSNAIEKIVNHYFVV